MSLDSAILVLELAGTVSFSASGALTALRKRMDLFGVCMMGLTTAVGGGVIRDLVLGRTPPATFRNPIYAAFAVCTALVLFLPSVQRQMERNPKAYDLVMLAMDTLGLGIFTVVGVRAAWVSMQAPPLFLLAFVGVITGVGGGVLRDVLAGDVPYIFVKHIYATASLAGALTCALLWSHTTEIAAMVAGMGVVSLIRGLSAHYHWNLPRPQASEQTD